MQFQVPQFIDVEDKIIGPLTVKQFFFLLGGAAAIFLLYATLPIFLAILCGIPIGLFAGALAFYKVHGQPFIKVVENAFKHYTKNKIYTWKKREQPAPQLIKEGKKGQGMEIPKLTRSKLEDLAWSLDIKQKQR